MWGVSFKENECQLNVPPLMSKLVPSLHPFLEKPVGEMHYTKR